MIDPQTVTQAERTLTHRRWDSDQGRVLAQQALQLRGRESDPTLSADQSDEVFSIMVASAGDRAIADLENMLAEANRQAEFFAGQFAARRSTGYILREALPKVVEGIRLARTCAGRLECARSKLSGDPGPPASLKPAPSEVEEIHAVFLAADAGGYIGELTRQLAGMEEELQFRLDLVVADIEQAAETESRGARNHGIINPHDAIYDRLAWLIWRRDDLRDKVARVAGDKSRAVEVQARAVAEVVEWAGGKVAVAKAVTDSRRMQGKYMESHPDWNGLDNSGRAVAGIDAQLAKLGEKPTGPLADQLRADRKAAESSWKSNCRDVDAELQATIGAELDAAMAGDEAARLRILGDSLAEPRAFPEAFSDRLDVAMFPKTKEGSALLALVLSTGLPLS